MWESIPERLNSLPGFQTPKSKVPSQGGGGTRKISATCLSGGRLASAVSLQSGGVHPCCVDNNTAPLMQKGTLCLDLKCQLLTSLFKFSKTNQVFLCCGFVLFFKPIHLLGGQDLVLAITLAYKGECCNRRPSALDGSVAEIRQQENSMDKQPNVLENVSASYRDSEL